MLKRYEAADSKAHGEGATLPGYSEQRLPLQSVFPAYPGC